MRCAGWGESCEEEQFRPATPAFAEPTRGLLAGLHFSRMSSVEEARTLEGSLRVLLQHPALVEDLRRPVPASMFGVRGLPPADGGLARWFSGARPANGLLLVGSSGPLLHPTPERAERTTRPPRRRPAVRHD